MIYIWSFYTMPTVTVQVIPVQVVEGVDWVKSKPAVVRVKAIWADGNARTKYSQIDVITGDVACTTGSYGPYEKTGQTFCRVDDPVAVNTEKIISPAEWLCGNSANFLRRMESVHY